MTAKKVQLDGDFWVGTQVMLDDLDALKADGFEAVINNRPDGEADHQPTSEQLRDHAEKLGLSYAHVPIDRGISPADVEAEEAALSDIGGKKVFAFCRSGTRSTLVWALARHKQGDDVERLHEKAAAAGYSLAPINHLL